MVIIRGERDVQIPPGVATGSGMGRGESGNGRARSKQLESREAWKGNEERFRKAAIHNRKKKRGVMMDAGHPTELEGKKKRKVWYRKGQSLVS